MQHVHVERSFPAPRERVWAAYTDHVGWSRWAGLGRVHLEREGTPSPDGSGAVRVISGRGPAVAEEVLDFEPPKRMTYRVIRGGLPFRDHLGEVDFQEEDGGTRIVWRCRFASKVPGLGWLWKAIVTAVFRRALAGLARELEAH